MSNSSNLHLEASGGISPAPKGHHTQATGLESDILYRWIQVFLANLPLALFLGWITTDPGGHIGMFAALPVLFVAGWGLCRRSAAVAAAMVAGGTAVAVMQLLGGLHFFVGSAALAASSQIVAGSTATLSEYASILGAFLAALVMGGTLMTFAVVIGFAFRSFVPDHVWSRQPDEAKDQTEPKPIVFPSTDEMFY